MRLHSSELVCDNSEEEESVMVCVGEAQPNIPPPDNPAQTHSTLLSSRERTSVSAPADGGVCDVMRAERRSRNVCVTPQTHRN